MLDSLHQFLYDARLFVCFVTVPVGLYSAWRCFLAVSSPADDASAPPGARTTRRMPSRPPGAPPARPGTDKPVQQLISDKPSGAPASVEAGEKSRLNKALASTIRIDSGDGRSTTGGDVAVAKPAEGKSVADEVGQLFAGLDDKLQPSAEAPKAKLTPAERSADALAKAGRLEQLGFHHPTPKDGTRVRAVSDPSKPTEAANGPELDDILAKLDKVLAEKPAAAPVAAPLQAPAAAAPAPAAAPSTPTATPAPKAPLWARADASDEDVDAKPEPGKQLGLFEEGKDKPKT
jgi:hypothetical protein